MCVVSQGIMEAPKLECRNQDLHPSIVRLSILGPLGGRTGFLQNKDTTITTIGGLRLWQTRVGLCPLSQSGLFQAPIEVYRGNQAQISRTCLHVLAPGSIHPGG